MNVPSFLQDLGYAVRKLKSAPSFSAIALITLALGIGANTAMFSVLKGVVLTPLSYPDANRLVRVWPEQSFNKSLFVRFQEDTRSFSGLSGAQGETFALTGDREPEELSGASVSVNYFSVVGVQPVLGRTFAAEEEIPGQGKTVILSHRLWQRRFGADPDILGRTLALGGAGEGSRTVIGVMPPDYRPLAAEWDVWTPLSMDPSNFPDYEGRASLAVTGRLAAGVTLQQAHNEIHELALNVAAEQSWISDMLAEAAGVVSVHDALVGDAKPRIMVLFSAVGLVLLIACGNVANLLLAQGSARRRETAMRIALGATRLRVIRQLLIETTALGLSGGALGLVLAVWTVPLLVRNLPAGIPLTDEIAVDSWVLGFTFLVSLFAGIVFGLLPAIRVTKPGVEETLKDGGRGSGLSTGRQRVNAGLAVAEAAMAAVLVIGAALMVKSAWLLHRVEPGFDAEQLLTLRTNPPPARYPDGESLRSYYADILQRLEAVPGVHSVAAINLLPMTGANMGMLWDVEHNPWPDGTPMPRANARSVSPRYFSMMGIPLIQGREFDRSDQGDAAAVMIINESMAAQIDPDGNVLGKRVGGFAGPDYFTVVGVVSDIHQHRLDLAARPEMYLPYEAWPSSRMYLLVRATGDAAEVLPTVQQAIWSLDPDVPISRARTMEHVIGQTLATSRLFTGLLTAFALLALLLGAVGMYGVMSYTVSQRTHEIGVRMALGAASGNVLRATTGRGVALSAAGVLIGLAGSLATGRVLSSYLFGVSTSDPTVYAGVAAFLVFVAGVASYIPALRASRVDPMIALRSE
jgi:putative ABC transport system permease protein